MTSFLTQVQGFTPLIEVMVKEVGIIQAAVYGVVWRYCQRRDRVCTASHDTLAEALGLSRGTVQRHIKELCEAGYLKDTTPDRKNRPHVYVDTGRAQIIGMVTATVSEKHTAVSENDTQVYQKSTRGDCESTQETHVAIATAAPADATDEKPVLYQCVDCGRFLASLTNGLCDNCYADMRDKAERENEVLDVTDEPPTCSDCEKPTATTADMPFVREVCTCKQEETLVDTFGPRPERPQRKPPPHWAQVAQEPWSSWGAESDEFQRQLQRYGEAGRDVQRLGADWQKLTQCPLDWNDKKAVKSWSSGLWTCLKAAGGDASIVLDATRKAIEGELSIANPYSVLKMTQALVGERRRGRPKPKVTPMMDQRGLDKPNPLARR